MVLLDEIGNVSLTAPECNVLAEACGLWVEEHAGDEYAVLFGSTMESAFKALAHADSFEMHIKKDQQDRSKAWMEMLTKRDPNAVRS